jgi:ABC-type amino acid transport system permease subunit
MIVYFGLCFALAGSSPLLAHLLGIRSGGLYVWFMSSCALLVIAFLWFALHQLSLFQNDGQAQGQK